MIGCRPLTLEEAQLVKRSFTGRNKDRNKALFLVGVNTGFRVTELLSLRFNDVLERDNSIKRRVRVERKDMKGKKRSRTVWLNVAAQEAIGDYLDALIAANTTGLPSSLYLGCYLFASERDPLKAIDRTQVWKIFNPIFERLELRGKLGTHFMRKTFANNLYEDLLRRVANGEVLDPLRITSKALDHSSTIITEKYLSFREADIDDSIENIGI